MSDNNISFDDLNEALLKFDAMTEASEAHGTLCGMICISGQADVSSWLALVFENQDPNNLALQESKRVLIDLHAATLEKLTSNNYDLDILIHNDDEPLDIRIEDLSYWCQGFLYGLSLAGLTDISKLPLDANEILQDMTDISKAGYSPEDDEEENEIAFAEIIEYIRVGVYVIYNTFNTEDSMINTTTVH